MNLKIGTFFKIPLYVNIYTVVLTLLLFATEPNVGMTYTAALLFVCLHEYGHCFAGKYFGCIIEDVVMYPIGGIARIEIRRGKWQEELIVASAGPLVNVLLVIVALPIGFWYSDMYLEKIAAATFNLNFYILAFNLLPVFPMDGGRILRAILCKFYNHFRATLYAVRLGQIIGVGVGIWFFYCCNFPPGFILLLMALLSEAEIAMAKLANHLLELRKNTAIVLNEPEIEKANLKQLVTILEFLDEEKLVKLGVDKLSLSYIKEIKESYITI